MNNKLFFGWYVVSGMFINYMVIVGIVSYTLPLFYPALIEEFGWSSSQVTLAATVSYFTSAFITPFVSALYDRFSVRKFMFAGSVMVVTGLALYGLISSVLTMVLLYLCFLTLSQVFCGQVPVMVILSRWFRRRRGVAMGIVLTATGAGGALFPLLVRDMVAAGDWRRAALVLALTAGLILAVALIFLIRNRPEEMGLSQDGAAPVAAGGPAADEGPFTGMDGTGAGDGPTLGMALRAPEFYLLAFATGGLWFIIIGMVQHQSIVMSSEGGVSAATLPLVISVYFWASVAGKVAFGWLGDRFDKTLVMLQSVVFLSIGLILLRFLQGNALFFYAILFGIGFGGTFTMIQLLIAEFYAGLHYGRILGILTMIDVTAGGLGIPVLALLRDQLGSYQLVIEYLIVLTLLIITAVTLLWSWKRREKLHFSDSVNPL